MLKLIKRYKKYITGFLLILISVCTCFAIKLNAAQTFKKEEAFEAIHRASWSGHMIMHYAYIHDTSGSTPLDITAYCANRDKTWPKDSTGMSLKTDSILPSTANKDLLFNTLVLGYNECYKDIDGDGINNGVYFTDGTDKAKKLNYCVTQLAVWSAIEGWPANTIINTSINEIVKPTTSSCKTIDGLTTSDINKIKEAYKDLTAKARQLNYSQKPTISMNYNWRTAFKQSDNTLKSGKFTITPSNLIDASYTIVLNNAPSGTQVFNGETDEDITGKAVKNLKSVYFRLPAQTSEGEFTFDVETSSGKYIKYGFYADDDPSKQEITRVKIRTVDVTYPKASGKIKYKVSAPEEGDFTLIKTEENGTTPLPVATIQILDSDKTTVLYTGITGDNGKISSTLPLGTYYYKEIVSPEGYILDSTLHEFTLSATTSSVNETLVNKQIKGSLTLNKKGDTNQPLQGAEFTIYADDKTTVITTKVTDDQGKIIIDNLPYGTYYYKETKAPSGYILDDTYYPFSIETNNQNVSKEVVNSSQTGTLIVTKTSAEGTALPNTEITVTNSTTGEVYTKTTGDDGKVTFDNLKVGTYYYQETKTPTGYVLNNTKHEFTISATQLQVEENLVNYPVKNTIQIVKSDSLDNSFLEGTVITLYDTKTNKEVASGTTNSRGVVAFADIPYGTYYYKETKAPSGYKLNTNKYNVEVTEDGVTQDFELKDDKDVSLKIKKTVSDVNRVTDNDTYTIKVSGKFDDNSTEKSITFNKNEIENNTEKDVPNVIYGETYTISEQTSNLYTATIDKESVKLTDFNTLVTVKNTFKNPGKLTVTKKLGSNTNMKDSDSFEIVIQGKFSDTNEISKTITITKNDLDTPKEVTGVIYGETYTISETPNQSYSVTIDNSNVTISETDKNVNVTNTIKDAGSLYVRKSADSNLVLDDETFEILVKGKFTDTSETTKKIQFNKNELNTDKEVTGVILGETYTIEETPNQNYTVSIDKPTVTMGKDAETVIVTNTRVPSGKLLIKKVVVDSTKSVNNEYTIKVSGNFSDTNETTKSFTFTTNDVKNGIEKEVPGVIYGNTYTISEDKNELYSTTIDTPSVTMNKEDTKVTVTNTINTNKIQITKKDVSTGELIPHAKIRIKDSTGKIVAEGETDNNGLLEFDNLILGKYTYQEYEAPEGYLIDDSEFPFEIKGNGEIVKATMTNKKISGGIEITKTDITDDKPLEGATITIKDEDGKIIEEKITGENGKVVFTNLTYGKYTYQETIAPDGYTINTFVGSFEIKDDGVIIKANIKDSKKSGGLELTKKDISTGELIPNAKFEILAEDKSTVIATGKTDENGVAKFKLDCGKYYYREYEAPSGYILDNSLFNFEIKENGEIVKAVMTNKPITGEIEITKKDVSTGDIIPWAKFEILAEDGKTSIVKGVTDADGKVTFKLKYGKYYYREYGAPSGYELDDTPFPFEIKENGEIIKCEMTNKPIEKSIIPKTGTVQLSNKGIIVSSIILIFAMVVLIIRRKNR